MSYQPDQCVVKDNRNMNKMSCMKQPSINLFILMGAILLIVIRHLDFFIHPRFWAEEASIFFLDAYTNGISALWHTHVGYYSIVPNVATYVATFVSLENAPIVTTLFALGIQIIPFYLIYISKAELFDTPVKKLMASLIVLFVGHTGEIWLNSITSQFHFIVILFLILIEPKETMGKHKTYLFYFLVTASGLSGVPGNILAPLFLYLYLRTKEKYNMHFFIILCATSLVQITALLSSDGMNRVHDYPLYGLIRHMAVSMFQYPFFYNFSVGVESICILPLVYILAIYIRQKPYFNIFFGSALILTVIMTVSSIGGYGAGRYSYAPGVILVLGLLMAVFDRSLQKTIRAFLLMYVGIAVGFGMMHFPISDGSYDSTSWKRWKQEVILYQNHSIDELTLYPQWKKTRKVKLPRKVNTP